MRVLIGALAVVAALAALTLITYREAFAAGTYGPTLTVEHCNGLAANFPASGTSTDPDLAGNPSCTTGATPLALNTATNLTFKQAVPIGHMNPGTALFVTGPGDDYVAPDASIANGTKAGGVTATMTISVANGACSTAINVDYILYESTTSNSVLIDPLDPGTADHLSNLATDSGLDGFADYNSPFRNSNPSFYPPIFDPDLDALLGINGPVAPLLPIARYTGMSRVIPTGSGEWSMLSVFVFNSSALAPFAAYEHNIPHSFSRLGRSPADGRVYFAVFDDPLEAAYGQSRLLETCSPLTTTAMLLGTLPNAEVRARTPTTSGTRAYSAWSYSARNADSDTLDNWLDSCPLVANAGTDADNDGIDGACDPTPSVNTGFGDHDGDGFNNREDNCPLEANWPQSSEREGEMYYITTAPDGGPRGDGIGNHCDPHQFNGYSEGDFIESYVMVPKCFGGTDGDGDRYCSTQDLNDSSASTPGYTLNRGPDTDGLPIGDGHGSNLEKYVGTDPLKACNKTTATDDESAGADAWPVDLNDSGHVNITDILGMKPFIGSAVPPNQRYDIVPSKTINIQDVLAIKPSIGLTCGITTRIDAEIAYEIANAATLIGSPETCTEMNVGNSIQIDITASAIPAYTGGQNGLTGFEFTFKYISSKIKVTALDVDLLLKANLNSSLLSIGDAPPNTDGTFFVSVGDIGTGQPEQGAGVLARITVEALASGTTAVELTNMVLTGRTVGGGDFEYPARAVNANLAIGTTCP
ncbi:MAG: hypothetical protein WD904_04410 [Dehalococcoidia bacterium]